MVWRIVSAVIVLFWVVMTGLVIRDAYFPDQSRFTVVPVRFVFDLFLSEAAAFNNALHLYHDDERIGYTSFNIRRENKTEEPPVYAVQASGALTLPLPATGQTQPEDVSFRIAGVLKDGEQWKSLELEIKTYISEVFATIAWKEGDEMPAVEIKKGGQVMMNTQLLKTMLAMKNGGLGGLPGLGGMDLLARLPELQKGGGNLPLEAREGVMDLAGKQRRCYIVSMKVLQTEEIRMYFTEIGELARIELPQGYRFVEPMMHGLEKDINTLK